MDIIFFFVCDNNHISVLIHVTGSGAREARQLVREEGPLQSRLHWDIMEQ